MSGVVLLSAVRTPFGRALGSLSDVSPIDLGALAVSEALRRAGLEPPRIDRALLGNLHAHDTRGNPAGAVLSRAGREDLAAAVTVRAGCVSGLMAISLACDAILSGSARCAIAGGFESASSAPHVVVGLRRGLRLGGGTLVDSARRDGPETDAAGLEGTAAALREAASAGAFKDEIAPIEVPAAKGSTRRIEVDDAARPPEEVVNEKATEGAPLADGAAAVVVASEGWAAAEGHRPLARLTALRSIDRSALQSVTAIEADVTAEAARRWLSDLPAATMRVVNATGGAADLGHASGADGARLVVRLVHRLRSAGGGRGLALASGAWGETAGILVEI